MSGVFFFDILAAHSGSDYENNLTAVKGASEGAYWVARNAPSNIFGYLLELHFYYWLGVLGNLFEDNAVLLRGITLFLTFMLVYPTLFSAAQLKIKVCFFPLLFVLFMHPRFLDLCNREYKISICLGFCFLCFAGKGNNT